MAETDSQPPAKRQRFDSPTWYDLHKTTVILRVDNADVTIYKELLCLHSKVFDTMFNRKYGSGTFTETDSGIVELEGEDYVVIKHFQRWLEAQSPSDGGDANPTPKFMRHLGFHQLIALYVFGERRDVPLLRNAVIDLLHPIKLCQDHCITQKDGAAKERIDKGELPCITTLGKIINDLPEKPAGLYHYLACGFAWGWTRKADKNCQAVLASLPTHFLRHVLKTATDVLADHTFVARLDPPIDKHASDNDTLAFWICLVTNNMRTIKTSRKGVDYIPLLDLCIYHEHLEEEEKEECGARYRQIHGGKRIHWDENTRWQW